MKCPRCAVELEEGARFCGACGAKVAAAPTLAKTLFSPPGKGPQLAAPGKGPQLALVAEPALSSDPLLGRVLNNRFVVESKLGEGGFGAVYRGKQLQVGREVALKILHPDMVSDSNVVARFRREGAVACALRDAHTITTYDFDQTPDGVLYIAMELLTGRSLHDVFHAEARLKWIRVVRIIEEVCSSLGEAHVQGVVHRDIKPENIYLENRPGHADFVKVLDFGIAKIVRGELGQSQRLTATGQTLGTLEYMSPEQLMGKPLDGRSDIYALGVVGYELMTGRLPFPDAQGPAGLIAAQLKQVPIAPSKARPDAEIPPEVDVLIMRTLEKDRAKRHADVNELRAEAEQILATVRSMDSRPIAMGSLDIDEAEESQPNHIGLWIALAVLAIGAVLGIYFGLRA